jgi:RNA polymerase sigma factor (sigma-70 family)
MQECETVGTRSDTAGVGRHAEEHLRRFVAARARGDGAGMRRWWEELVIDFFDRMDGLVYTAHRGRLGDDEHETAVALSLARFSKNLIATFEGASMGELVNACRTLARGICIDVQRKSIRERRVDAASLDRGWDAPEGSASSAWEADAAVERFERDQRSSEVRDFLSWALPQIAEDRRRVLELTFDGVELAEIAGALAISKDNAYQRRSRGMRDLGKLKERYDA